MKDNENTLKIDKFTPFLEGLQDALEELEDYPSDFELLKLIKTVKLIKNLCIQLITVDNYQEMYINY